MDGRVARDRMIRLWAQAINRGRRATTVQERREAQAYELGVADSIGEVFGALDVLDARQQAEKVAALLREPTVQADEDQG